MGLKELFEKYGEPEFYKRDWFILSDNAERKQPDYRGYVVIQDGKILGLKNVPEELEERVKALVEAYLKAQDPEALTGHRKVLSLSRMIKEVQDGTKSGILC